MPDGPTDRGGAAAEGRTPAAARLQALAASRMELTAPAYARAALIMGCGVQEGGQGCHIIDHEGRRFLDLFDAYGNQAFGYGHPRLLAALRRQLESGHTNSAKVFFDAMPTRLAEALSRLTGGALPCSFLTNGGAEAIEHALKLARAHTGRTRFVTAANAYHGKTTGALAAACRPEYEHMFGPLMPEFRPVPFGDATALAAAVDGNTAGVLLETLQAEGGIAVAPEGYLREARAICDRHGAVLILDEIQAGFGRTGRFFAFEHAGVLPDIVCIGKSFGGGMLATAAMMARRELWEPFRSEPLAFGSSLGGSPLAAAVGLETIAMASDPAFLAEVRAKGEIAGARLAAMAAAHPRLVRRAHGLGLMQGLTLADPAITGLVLRLLYERGVVTSFCLFDVCVLRIEPPLIITEAELTEGLDALAQALVEAEEELARLPPGGLGVSAIEGRILVPGEPAAVFARLADPELLLRHAPTLRRVSPAGERRWSCRGRIDEVDVDWEETFEADPATRRIEQRVQGGFWQRFDRAWEVRSAPGGGRSEVTLRLDWDVGTGGFERVLSLRLRRSLSREVDRCLAGLAAALGGG